eukprot:SAG11_NODE_31506_length_291_cov_0.859375_1_plen_27_part_10
MHVGTGFVYGFQYKWSWSKKSYFDCTQ